MKKVTYPEEIQLYYVLPTIRRALAKALKKNGLSQKKIAELLGVTEAAISQYLSDKRGSEVKLPKDFLETLNKVAFEVGDKDSAVKEIIRLMKLAASNKIICDIHKSLDSEVKTNCSVCY